MPRSVQLREAFESNYSIYQYRFVEFLVEHLTDVSRQFRGDLQQVLVLALIGQSYLHGVNAKPQGGNDDNSTHGHEVGTINASRIADVSGIPRETVRRKLSILQERGWVVQHGRSGWRLVIEGKSSKAKNDLKDLDARAVARVARLVADLEKLT